MKQVNLVLIKVYLNLGAIADRTGKVAVIISDQFLLRHHNTGRLKMKKEQLGKIFSVAIFVLSFAMLTSHVGYAGDVANGQALYEGKCIICHGAGGTPAMPGIPDFSKGEKLDKDVAVLKKSILEGMTPEGGMPMPPMQGQLSDSELDDLLAYVLSLKP